MKVCTFIKHYQAMCSRFELVLYLFPYHFNRTRLMKTSTTINRFLRIYTFSSFLPQSHLVCNNCTMKSGITSKCTFITFNAAVKKLAARELSFLFILEEERTRDHMYHINCIHITYNI